MLRALGFQKKETTLSNDEAAPLILQQAHDFELALQAMDYLLDDRTKEGLHLIENDQNTTIKVLATGVIRFLEATLGFEPEIMKKAGEILTKAENLSHRDRTKYQRTKLKTSGHFPPGTEYAVTHAEATLLNALIMLMSESMIESAKALYKLRKAYHTLDEVFVLIKEYEKTKKQTQTQSSDLNNLSNPSSSTINSTTSSIFTDIPFSLSNEQLKNTKITSFAESIAKMRSQRLNGAHIGNSPAQERLRTELGYNSEKLNQQSDDFDDSTSTAEQRAIDESQSTIDEFIISGANLCFGILQLVLSLIPPAIGKVLSVVGIKGSKETGLKMIWKSLEGRNVHGSIGLLALLVFYDGPFQFTDADFDIPDLSRTKSKNSTTNSLSIQKTMSAKRMRSETNAYQGIGKPTLLHPGKKLEDALLYARALFPNSALWLLQEARMLASRGRLEEALQLMDSLDRKIEMVQVEALLIFDRSMILIFLHQYERAAKEILKLVEINSWSPGLYTYCAGACYLELYRMCQMGIITDPQELKRESYFRDQAKDLFQKAPYYAKNGKKNNMPFNKFVLRKTSHFEHSAHLNKVDLIDAVGTSPVHELAYFWNGYNRMPVKNLETAYILLNYSKSEHSKIPELENESMIRNLLQSITLRRLGEFTKGAELLDTFVLPNIIEIDESNTYEPYRFIRHTEDPWLYPTALYEKALFLWKEFGIDGLDEAREWLKRAQSYSEDYELSTRIGMKIKAAHDRLEGL